ncbi:MAG: hypothetical protein KTV77_04685 [Wolbachia endosymbiont of Fragariocoptes setiger]|nr:hypothetical protein [Wolbachia endosymbiont of Fragariocoptes setiger]
MISQKKLHNLIDETFHRYKKGELRIYDTLSVSHCIDLDEVEKIENPIKDLMRKHTYSAGDTIAKSLDKDNVIQTHDLNKKRKSLMNQRKS